MPRSGVAFVRVTRRAQDARIDNPHLENVMCIELDRLLRNAGFALASAAILLGIGYTIEVLPVTALAQ